jgi:hypothetical protein
MVLTAAKTLRLVAGVVIALGVSQAAMPAANAAPITNVPDDTASFNGDVRSVEYFNGVIYVGGAFTAATQNGQTIPRNHVAAIDEETGDLLPWNPNTNGTVWALAVTPSATYLGGSFGRVGGVTRHNIASVATAGTGSVNAGFTASVTSGSVKAIAASGSSVYAGGTFTVADGQARSRLASFDAQTGALNTGFNAVPNDTVRTLAVGNGEIYAGGEFTTMNGLTRGRHLAPVDPTTGALQAGFNSDLTYRVMNIAVTSTTIYAAADGSGGHLWATALNGAQRWIVTADGGFQAVTVLGDTVYAGGHFGNVCSSLRTGSHGACLDGSAKRQKLLAVDTDANLQAWAPQANSSLGVFDLDSDPATGRIAAGGQFTGFNFGRISQPHFAQFG